MEPKLQNNWQYRKKKSEKGNNFMGLKDSITKQPKCFPLILVVPYHGYCVFIIHDILWI